MPNPLAADFTDLSSLEYDTDFIIPELILLTSLLLRSPEEFLMPRGAGAEYKSEMRRERNVWLLPLVPNLLRGRKELFYTEFLPQNFLLPDVCLCCLTAYGLTVAGRVRTDCPSCGTEEDGGGWRMWEELGVFWVPTQLQELLLCQLLYKYYSPNGDPTWVLQIPTL